jgi:hypothetical protein
MIRRVILTSALAAVLVAMSFSTAQAGTVSTDTWAPKFCKAVTQYEQTLEDQSSTFQSNLGSSTNLKAVRAKLVSFLATMEKAANTAKQQIQRAGAPSATNGTKISAKFVSALGKSASVFADAKDQAAKVSTASPKAFEKQATQVGTDLEKAGKSLSAEFGNIKQLDTSKKIQTSLQAAPECSALTTGSSSSSSS